jgi:sRNA-binding protein
MSRPNTRSKNIDQHPGEIVLKARQKRRTSQQVQEDKARVQQRQQEQAASDQRDAERIAAIEDKKALEKIKVLMDAPKPKPRPVPVRARPTTVSQPEGQEGIVKGVVESRDIEMMDVELAVDGELD